MKRFHREQIEDIMRESGKELDRLHGQKMVLRKALRDIENVLIPSINYQACDEISEIIRKTLVLTFG